MQKLFIILLTLLFPSVNHLSAQDFTMVQYGPGVNQFLDIYLAPSATATPVLVYAHQNGGTTEMPDGIITDLKAAGISTVSWESVQNLSSRADLTTGWADAELVFEWVKDSAAVYNFDTTNIVVGGSSRGSILSWIYGHSGNPCVKGLYMFNALPDGIWQDLAFWDPRDEITSQSPPLFLVYRPRPGVDDNEDSHDPNNGFMIMDRYTSLGIGDRDTIIHSLIDSANMDRFQYLVDFALSVIVQGPIQPVDLVDFSGKTEGDDIKLHWQTASEVNNEKFEIEESLDGNEFQKIGEVKGFGTTSIPKTYGFSTPKPNRYQSFYRLKQVDFDGQFEYSPIINLVLQNQITSLEAFYPNPNKSGVVNITYNAIEDGKLGVEVYDLSGGLVYQQTQTVIKGNNKLSLNFAALRSGMYIVKFGHGRHNIIQKLIID